MTDTSETTPLRIDLVPAKKQDVWKWPAALNLIFSGAGSGLYIVSYILRRALPETFQYESSIRSGITSAIFIVIGFSFVSVEVGRLSSAINVLKRVSSSWISREVLCGTVFLAAILLNLFFPNKILPFVAFLAAAGILVSQGFILNTACAVETWNLRIVPLLVFFSGLHSGYAMSLIIHSNYLKGDVSYMASGVLINVLNLIIWINYVKAVKAQFNQIARPFNSRKINLAGVGIGHVCAVLLIITAGFLWHQNSRVELGRVFLFIAGICMFLGNSIQKAAAVLKAGYRASIWISTDR